MYPVRNAGPGSDTPEPPADCRCCDRDAGPRNIVAADISAGPGAYPASSHTNHRDSVMKTTQTQKNSFFSSRLFGRVARVGIMPMLLAISLVACQRTDDVDGLESIDETGAAQDDFGMAGTTDDHIVAVNITDEGEVIPEVTAGRAMFRISNEGNEDCSLRLVQTEAAPMSEQMDSQDATTNDPTQADNTDAGMEGAEGTENDPLNPGTEGTQDNPLMDSDTPEGDAYDASGRTDAATDATQEGTLGTDGTQTVEAGQEATISLDLQPGVYEITCEGAEDQAGQTAAPREPMKVLVSDASLSSQPDDGTMQDGVPQDGAVEDPANRDDAGGTVGAIE